MSVGSGELDHRGRPRALLERLGPGEEDTAVGIHIDDRPDVTGERIAPEARPVGARELDRGDGEGTAGKIGCGDDVSGTIHHDIRRRPEPLVALAEALTDGPSLSLEVLFAPLAAHDGGPERYLGLYQPLAMVSRLQGRPALELSVRALRRPATANEETAPVRLATLYGRRVA